MAGEQSTDVSINSFLNEVLPRCIFQSSPPEIREPETCLQLNHALTPVYQKKLICTRCRRELFRTTKLPRGAVVKENAGEEMDHAAIYVETDVIVHESTNESASMMRIDGLEWMEPYTRSLPSVHVIGNVTNVFTRMFCRNSDCWAYVADVIEEIADVPCQKRFRVLVWRLRTDWRWLGTREA